MRALRRSLALFARLIGPCPVCGGVLDAHAYHAWATAVPGSDTCARVTDAIARRDWNAARCHEWDPEKDSLQFSVIDCPRSSSLGLVATCHTFELMSSSYVEWSEALTEEESSVLRREIGDDWTFFLDV